MNPPWDSYVDAVNKVVIEEGVTRIGNYAFTDCPELKNVTILATIPPILYNPNFSAENDTLYVPVGCVEAYKAIPEWRNAFATITEIQ